MARGVDELVEFLLEEIALRGDQGATLADVRKLVLKFYTTTSNDRTNSGYLETSNTGLSADQHSRARETATTVGEKFLQKVWEWLLAHPDITAETENTSPDDIVLHEENLDHEHAAPELSSTDLNNKSSQNTANNGVPDSSSDPANSGRHNNVVLRSSIDRMWQTLAGHGMDTTRIRAAEFTLLSLIGAAGPKGIKQPDLTALSGQDKRSLPHRTDELHRKGYIEKRAVKLRGLSTSLCTLRRWVVTASLAATPEELNSADALREKMFGHGELRPESFLEIILQLLRDPGDMLLDEIRRRMGIQGHRWENRVFVRWLKTLESCGVIRRIKAPPEEQAKDKVIYKTIEFVQEPSSRVRAAFKKYAKLGGDISQEDQNALDVEEVDESTAALPDAADTATVAVPQIRQPPVWDAERLFLNHLFELVNDSGPQGISSMDLGELIVGPFYKRPLDQSLSHVTDAWEESQPAHLRHLALVRDTGLKRRFLHYQYRSYGNFKLAVEADETSWEAVHTQSEQSSAANDRQLLDPWGFPIVGEKMFLGLDGSATLSESRTSAVIPPQPTGYVRPSKAGLSGGVKIGRPRKYPVGQEPYHSGNLSARKKAAQATKALEAKRPEQAKVLARNELELPDPVVDGPATVDAPAAPPKKLGRPRKKVLDLAAEELATAVAEPAVPPKKRGRPRKKLKTEHNQAEDVVQTDVLGMVRPNDNRAAASVGEEGETIVEGTSSALDLDGELATAHTTDTNVPRRKRKQHAVSPDPVADDTVITVELAGMGETGVPHEVSTKATEIEDSLPTLSIPGVYINPPGRGRKHIGRPRKHILFLVFKLAQLKSLDWFIAEDPVVQSEPDESQTLPGREINCQSTTNTVSTKQPAAKRHKPNPQSGPNALPIESTLAPTTQRMASHVNESGAEGGYTKLLAVTSEYQTRQSPHPPQSAADLPPMSLNASERTTSPHTPTQNYSLTQTIQNESSGTLEQTNASADMADFRLVKTLPDGRVARYGLFPHSFQQTETENVMTTNKALGAAAAVAESNQRQSEHSRGKQPAPQTNPDEIDDVTPGAAPDLSVNPNEKSLGKRVAIQTYDDATDVLESNAAPDHNENLAENPNKDKSTDEKMRSRREGVSLTGGTVGLKRARILIRALTDAGGVYPGDRELFQPYVFAVRKQEPQANPDPHTVVRAMQVLHDKGTIRRVKFAFKDKNGIVVNRNIVMFKNIDPQSDQVKEVQRKMIEAHPRRYYPPGAEIDPGLREQPKPKESKEPKEPAPAVNKTKKVRNREAPAAAEATTSVVGAQATSSRPRAKAAKKPKATAELPIAIKRRGRQPKLPPPQNPEWMNWADKENIQGIDTLRNAIATKSTATISAPIAAVIPKSGENLVEEFVEPEISEEQAAMQSTFSLENYTHNAEAAEVDVGEGRSARYSKLQPWHKPTVPKPSKSRRATGAAAAEAATEEVASPPASESTQTSPTPQPDNYSAIMRFDNGLIYDATMDAHQTAASSYQPFTEFPSVQPTYPVNGNNKVPQGELVLSNPKQIFNHVSGTFSTEFVTGKELRPRLTIQPNMQRQFEDAMPSSIQDIYNRGVERLVDFRKEGFGDWKKTFEQSVNEVEDWEIQNAKKLTSGKSLMVPRFINHIVPAEVARDVQWQQPEPVQPTTQAIPRETRRALAPFRPLRPRPLVARDMQPAVYANTALATQALADFTQRASLSSAPDAAATFRPPNRHVYGQEGRFQVPNAPPRAQATPISRPNDQLRIQQYSGPSTAQSNSTSAAFQHVIQPPQIIAEGAVVFSDEQRQRFIMCVVAVRSLCGGEKATIDWNLVHDLMPGFARIILARRWTSIRTQDKALVDEIQDMFWTQLPDALLNGEVPNIENTVHSAIQDWEYVIEWALKTCVPGKPIETSEEETEPSKELPTTSTQLQEKYDVVDTKEHNEFWKEDVFNASLTDTRRKHTIQGLPFILPKDFPTTDLSASVAIASLNRDLPYRTTESRPSMAGAYLAAVADSYVRANVLTPDATYNPEEAKERLMPFGDEVLNEAVSRLVAAKIIKQENKGRSAPSRNYSISDQFQRSFNSVSYDIEEIFHEAARFKFQMDTGISQEGFVDIGYHIKDHHMIVIMNLIASKRISVRLRLPPLTSDPNVPSVDPVTGKRSLSTWGFTEKDYKTVHMDRDNLRFPLRIYPTKDYIHGIPLRSPRPERPGPHLKPVGPDNVKKEHRIPIWFDIHNQILPQIWDTVIAAVLTLTALRVGYTAEDIVTALKHNVELWEIELAVGWLVDLGVVKRMESGGLMAGEWWWAVMGG